MSKLIMVKTQLMLQILISTSSTII